MCQCPQTKKKYVVFSDASGLTIGAILSQEQENRVVVIAYASKALSTTQRNYCVTMRELKIHGWKLVTYHRSLICQMNHNICKRSVDNGICDMFVLREGVFYKKYIPDDNEYLTLIAPLEIRQEIFQLLHSHHTTGHFGRDRMTDLIRKRFYWPNIHDYVQRWCETCDRCAHVKPGPGVGKSPLKSIKSSRRFQIVALDIVGQPPITDNSCEYILVISDYFTKFVVRVAEPYNPYGSR
ncbi:hypothetical protein MAR_031766 [Mya arenaria]|uniref:Polyprotein n=1 Tax=Mya arenaria TaxID=6604 RepID=A0ABY7F816_MYAAR|nr:hypothetical protein MAR_031766 [Mya arenaria]